MAEHKARIMDCPECQNEALILEKNGKCLPCLWKFCDRCKKNIKVPVSSGAKGYKYICPECENENV